MSDNQYVFFIGGKDLEMETIKQLLDGKGAEYVDKNLGWGAKTSAYEAEIAQAAAAGKTPVIIELEQDCKLPKNTVNIDHHNQNAARPASVLQICDLLGIEKTRDLQLIGANDAAYIPGMMEMAPRRKKSPGYAAATGCVRASPTSRKRKPSAPSAKRRNLRRYRRQNGALQNRHGRRPPV